jgi:hypothetical protein
LIPIIFHWDTEKRRAVLSILLEGSVGLGGRNNPIDVAVIQRLLKICLTQFRRVKGRSTSVLLPGIKIDGQCTPDLIEHIKSFQKTTCGFKNPDGRVDPMGKTFKTIIAQAKPTTATVKQLLFGTLSTNTGLLTKIKPELFKKFYIKQSGLGLTLTKGEDLLGFFKYLQNDPDIKDIRWAAYIIATADRETGQSFKSNEEVGKGGNRRYAVPKQINDHLGCRGPKNQIYTNKYYGRGYVHLTHDTNYKAIGKAYGIGDELYINPGRALEPQIAYFATSYGMRHGTFTGHKLSMHINGNKCDYKAARQISNGTNKDKEIAENAKKIEILLRLCADPLAMISNDHALHFC